MPPSLRLRCLIHAMFLLSPILLEKCQQELKKSQHNTKQPLGSQCFQGVFTRRRVDLNSRWKRVNTALFWYTVRLIVCVVFPSYVQLCGSAVKVSSIFRLFLVIPAVAASQHNFQHLAAKPPALMRPQPGCRTAWIAGQTRNRGSAAVPPTRMLRAQYALWIPCDHRRRAQARATGLIVAARVPACH